MLDRSRLRNTELVGKLQCEGLKYRPESSSSVVE